MLQGSADLSGTGNALANSIFGNSGNNTLDGQGGADILTGNAGNDTFVFNVGQANGDTVVDFAGNGAAAGDSLLFVGYGAGASFTNIDATHWQVNYNGGASHDVITFMQRRGDRRQRLPVSVNVEFRSDHQIARRSRSRAVVRRSNFTPNAASSRSSSNMSCARPCATMRPASITMTLSKNRKVRSRSCITTTESRSRRARHQGLHHIDAVPDVEAGGRLVRKQGRRIHGQHHGQEHARALTA